MKSVRFDCLAWNMRGVLFLALLFCGFASAQTWDGSTGMPCDSGPKINDTGICTGQAWVGGTENQFYIYAMGASLGAAQAATDIDTLLMGMAAAGLLIIDAYGGHSELGCWRALSVDVWHNVYDTGEVGQCVFGYFWVDLQGS